MSGFKFGANNPKDPDGEHDEGGADGGEESPRELVPVGRYMARPVDVALGFTKDDKPQVAITFEILDNGKRIAAYRFFTEKAFPRTIKDLKTCGWKGDDVGSITIEDLTNDVRIEVTHEEYKGKMNHRVAWINDPSENPVMSKLMNDDEKSRFGAEMRARMGDLRSSAASSPNPPAKSTEKAKAAGGTKKKKF